MEIFSIKMPEKKIKEKVLKKIKKDLTFAIGAIVVGAIGSLILWQIGYVALLAVVIFFVGLYELFKCMAKLTNWRSDKTYLNWEAYGKSDLVLEEIEKIIEKLEKQFDFKIFCISDGWLINPVEWLFVKLEDINWVYLNKEDPKQKDEAAEIFVNTNFGIQIPILCAAINVPQIDNPAKATVLALATIKQEAKKAVFGFSDKTKDKWETGNL